MANEERDAKIVVSADYDQYIAATNKASTATTKFNKSLDETNKKADSLLKKMSNRLILGGIGGGAALGGTAMIAAQLEKQMANIQASAANKNTPFDVKNLTKGIMEVTRELPVARGEVVQLTSAITQMGVSSTSQINKMTRQFVEFGAAVGESSNQLAQMQIGYARQMGTMDYGPSNTARLNDATTVLSSRGGVAASSILGFASNIAPAARIAGMSQQATLGLSTAFNRAGADGGYAASTFSTIVNDVERLKRTDSPLINKYAVALGTDRNTIKEMSAADLFSKIAEKSASSEGPQTLEMLGFDGARATKALQAIGGSGEINKWIKTSEEAYSSNKNETEDAAKEAMSGFFDNMVKLKNQFTVLGQTMGEVVLPPLSKLTEVLASVASFATKVLEPIAKISSALGGLSSVLAILAGGALRSWAVGATPLLAKQLSTTTFGQSFKQGAADSRNQAVGLPSNSMWGNKVADGSATYLQTKSYNMGGRIGGWYGRHAGPGDVAATANPVVGAAKYAATAAGAGARGLGTMIGQQYSLMGAAPDLRPGMEDANKEVGKSGFMAQTRQHFRNLGGVIGSGRERTLGQFIFGLNKTDGSKLYRRMA